MNAIIKNIRARYVKDSKIGRNISLRDDDVFLVSYPKSGGTWLRFLLANLLTNNITYSNIEKIVPSIYTQRDSILTKMSGRRFLKSSECFDPRYRYVLYVVRDPRCVVLAHYGKLIKDGVIAQDYPLSDFVKHFISDGACSFGTWGEHVESWYHLRKSTDKQFLLIRYEDLVESTKHVLSKLCAFLNIEYNNDLLEKARDRSLFKKIAIKKDGKCCEKTYPMGKDNPSCTGVCWQIRLSESDINLIEGQFGETMTRLGYNLVTY
ncbi:MAG: sulfotransferase domain-containing protein [Bacteroidales bacterium]